MLFRWIRDRLWPSKPSPASAPPPKPRPPVKLDPAVHPCPSFADDVAVPEGEAELVRAYEASVTRPPTLPPRREPVWLTCISLEQAVREDYEARLGDPAPHVLPIHAVIEDNHKLYIDVATVKAPSLRDRLEASGPLEPSDAVDVALQVSAHLIARRLESRLATLLDEEALPPSPVASESLYVVQHDGRAHAMLADIGNRTPPDHMCDRCVDLVQPMRWDMAIYLSPEGIQGKRPTESSLVYSTALLLHELLTGDRNWNGSEEMKSLFNRLKDGVPAPEAELPEHTRAWMLWSLNPEAEQRPQTLLAFAAGLKHAAELDELGVRTAFPRPPAAAS